jgi:hypothetical protein
MNDMALLRRPVTAGVSAFEARGAVGELVAAIATVNDVLDQLESSTDAHATLHGRVLAAVSATLAGVPNAEGKGLTLAHVHGKARLMVNTDALADALSKDPHALDVLASGEYGLTAAVSEALAINTDVALSAIEPPSATADPRPGTDAIQSARLLTQMRTLQLLDTLPSTSRHRLELLV